MNNENLQELYYHNTFRAAVQMGLLKYINYQKSMNYPNMSEEYKAKFLQLETKVFGNLDIITEKMAKLVIGDTSVMNLNCYHELTDAIVQTALEYTILNQIDTLIA